MKPIISPDVINILCEDYTPPVQQMTVTEPQVESEPLPKKSFWGRVCGFFKKAVEVITPVLNIVNTVAGAINAVVRFRNAFWGRAEPQYAW